MNPSAFDRLCRSLSPASTRRRLVALAIALPLAGGLTGIAPDDAGAERPVDRLRRRRASRRRKQRNRRDGNNNRNKSGGKLGGSNCIPPTSNNEQPTDLQQIINNASPFANIVLCAGAFVADGLQISKGISIIGAGSDGTDQKSTTLFGSNPFAPNGSNTNGILAISAGNVFISNLVISGADGDVPAVGIAGGEVTLAGVLIERNAAGGIVNEGGALRLTSGTQVIGNGSDAEGGGILHRGGTTTVASGCLIEGNTATDGGGIFDGTGLANDIQLTDTFIVTRNTPNNCSPSGAVQNCVETS